MAEGSTSPRAGEAESAYDPHECEFCGKMLENPGEAFLDHLKESETCLYLWRAYLPYIHEDAGAD